MLCYGRRSVGIGLCGHCCGLPDKQWRVFFVCLFIQLKLRSENASSVVLFSGIIVRACVTNGKVFGIPRARVMQKRGQANVKDNDAYKGISNSVPMIRQPLHITYFYTAVKDYSYQGGIIGDPMKPDICVQSNVIGRTDRPDIPPNN